MESNFQAAPEPPYPVQFSVEYPDRSLNRLTTAFRVIVAIPMIVFRQKYPRWWFDWNLELLRFSNRVSAYLALMNDRYPSTDERQTVSVDFPYPDARHGLNRW